MIHSDPSDVQPRELLTSGPGEGEDPLDVFATEAPDAASVIAPAGSEPNHDEPLDRFGSEATIAASMFGDTREQRTDVDPLDWFATESATAPSFVDDRCNRGSDVTDHVVDDQIRLRGGYGRIAASSLAMAVLITTLGWFANGRSLQPRVENTGRQTPAAEQSQSALSDRSENRPEQQPTSSSDETVAARERPQRSVGMQSAVSQVLAHRPPVPAERNVDPPAPTRAGIADPWPHRSDLTGSASVPLSSGMPSADATPVVEPSTPAVAPTIGYGPTAPVPQPVARAGSAEGAVVTTGVTATPAIESVINGYVEAFNALDAGAATAVWPGVDQRALRRAFESVQAQHFELRPCRIAVTDSRSVALCEGTAEYVPRVGNRTLRSEPRRWTFHLRNRNNQWVIDAVEVR